jgi:hypothetical protein
MLRSKLAIFVLCCSSLLAAQNLPAGTALPVAVGTTLTAKGSKAGQKIDGKLMQEVRLPSGAVLKSGSHVTGHVISAKKPGAGGSSITVQFDQLQNEHQAIPLNVSVRAVAGSNSVFNAGLPSGNNTDQDASDSWVTLQIGGEYVFRGRGVVESDHGKVGVWDGRGVWGKLQSAENCDDSQINSDIQALWIFSTTACGAYDLPQTTLAHAGNTPPLGQVTLQSTKNVEIHGGSGWLLIVNPAPGKAGGK